MITTDELEAARPDLEDLLAEVLTSVFGEQAHPVDDDLPDGGHAVARLAVADEADGGHLGVRVRTGPVLSRLLASRMFSAGDPSQDDLLDAVGELGNIAAGNVKSLFFASARLSLPDPALDAGPAVDRGSTTVRASVLGQVVELALTPGAPVDGLTWPPTASDDLPHARPHDRPHDTHPELETLS
jgi:hypothetical protein